MKRYRLDEVENGSSERNRSIGSISEIERLSGAAVQRPAITEALTQAFFEEWARVGYGALSLETVAREAGVGKAALYRRWRSKADMASDLVRQIGAASSKRLAEKDRGSLEADLEAMLLFGARMMRDPLVSRIMPDLYATMDREPALTAALRPSEDERGEKVRAVIDRAIRRGELDASIDRAVAYDLLFGPLYWHLLVVRHPIRHRHVRMLARATSAALRLT